MAPAALSKPIPDAVHLTAEALLAQLAPEPRGAAAALTETPVEIDGVVVDDGLANTRSCFWIGLGVLKLLYCAVVEVQLTSEFSIGDSRC